MKIVKESINFERGLSDREIRSKLIGFRKGQILADKKIDNSNFYGLDIDGTGIYKLDIYIGEHPNYLGARYNIQVYPFGYISGSGKLVNMNRMADASNLMTNDSKLRVLKDDEIDIVKSYLNDPKNKEIIKGMEEYHNLKIFL